MIFFEKLRKVRPAYVVDADPFNVAIFYNEGNPEECKAVVTVATQNVRYEFNASTDVYWFLFSAKDDADAIKEYFSLLSIISNALAVDSKFLKDISGVINRYLYRLGKEGAKNAKKVTKEQEEIDQDLMEGTARYIEAAKKEKKENKGKKGKKGNVK